MGEVAGLSEKSVHKWRDCLFVRLAFSENKKISLNFRSKDHDVYTVDHLAWRDFDLFNRGNSVVESKYFIHVRFFNSKSSSERNFNEFCRYDQYKFDRNQIQLFPIQNKSEGK